MARQAKVLGNAGLLAAVLLLAASACRAAPGSLPNVPLFLSNQTKPNLLLALDDSISMDYELLMPSNDGALWWNTNDQSFVGRDENNAVQAGRINVNQAGSSDSVWKQYIYLFPNGDNSSYNGRRMLADSWNSHFALPPVDAYAYARSPDYNKAYYNPARAYTPWPSYGSYSFGAANPAAAPYDPVYTSAGNLDLTHDFDANNPHWDEANWRFKFYPGMRDENNLLVAVETLRPVAYFPATYYRPAGSPDSSSYNADPSCATCLAPDGGPMDKYEIKPGNYSSSTAYQAAIQNFANWFSYYRRRHQAMRAGIAQSLDNTSATRVGIFTTNNRTTITMRDLDNAADKAGLFNLIYTAVSNHSYSPNRSSLAHAGSQLGRADSQAPIQYECQQNAALLVTDGFSGAYTPMGYNHNYDRHQGTPYQDSDSGTLADIAMRYYNAIGTSPSGTVPADSACSLPGHAPWLDCNSRPHMNTFALTLGGQGLVYGESHHSIEDAYSNPPAWRSPSTSRSPDQVDDLYHAAINGRGDILHTYNTTQVSSRLTAALNHVAAVSGSAASAGFNTSSITAETAAYLPSFDSAGWSGDLTAWKINSDGSVGATLWSAAERLQNRSLTNQPRSIVTYNADLTKGIPLQWGSLNTTQKNDLRTEDSGDIETADDTAKERLQFIRGKRGCERSALSSCSVTRSFRDRSSILGDFIHASAVYAGEPNQHWPASSPFPTSHTYTLFKQSMSSRPGMVYAAGNDGMLHAFRADTGEEQFAYLPGALFESGTSDSGLHYLTQADYRHRDYVDATPTVSDAYLGGAWKTVLVGGLRGGGRAFYALDVTHPEVMDNETDTASKVMWEFSHPDLGYSYSRPVIAPLGNGSGIDWYVIFGNGYNDPNSGPHDGQAQLFILKLSGPGSDGVWDLNQDYYVLSTGIQSRGGDTRNGLSSPQVVDYSGDYIADRVYAGDLFGNLWAFDLRGSLSNAAVQKMFTTIDQLPITAKPAVAFHPDMPFNDATKPNLMVLFGSGQYLVNADKGTTSTQYYYGLWDNQADLSAATTIPLTDLVEQGPVELVSTANGNYRVMPNPQAVAYADPSSPKRGWYLPLPDNGERVVNAALSLGRVVYLTTSIPTQEPCGTGGSGWLMGLDLASGARTLQSVLDSNRDTRVNWDDRISVSGSAVVVSGQQQSNLPQAPANLGTGLYTKDSNGNLQLNKVGDGSAGDMNTLKRQSWRQLYYEQLK